MAGTAAGIGEDGRDCERMEWGMYKMERVEEREKESASVQFPQGLRNGCNIADCFPPSAGNLIPLRQ